MQTIEILTAPNLSQLKALGTFYEVKTTIEQAVGNKLGVKGWDSLYKKIENLKKNSSIRKK